MRYAVFCFPEYDAAGGWNDYVGGADDLDEAISIARATNADEKQVVDLTDGRVVWEEYEGQTTQQRIDEAAAGLEAITKTATTPDIAGAISQHNALWARLAKK